jgi:hypothetical protein
MLAKKRMEISNPCARTMAYDIDISFTIIFY